jgi:hypothetical protein
MIRAITLSLLLAALAGCSTLDTPPMWEYPSAAEIIDPTDPL